MKTNKYVLVAGLFLASTAVSADERQPVGAATQALMELQKSGAQASEHSRPIKGDVAKRSHERYLRSFEYEIPPSLTREAGSR